MMRTRLLPILLSAVGLSASSAAQIHNPGNGHYYEVSTLPYDWYQARVESSMRTFMGVQGHLATISTPEENAFIVAQWGEQARGKHLGAQRIAGNWEWVTGEPFAYQNWAPGEPSGSNLFVLSYSNQSTLGTWSAVPDYLDSGFIVEYDVPQARTLSIQSANPGSGVPITVYTADRQGLKNGTTTFTRLYDPGATVSMTAPANVGGQYFDRWEKNGVSIGTNKTIQVLMDADHTLKAVFLKAFTLTVNSENPGSGVPISVWKADELGRTNGSTTFTRLYTQGTPASFTAPQTIGDYYFKRWNLDGASWLGTATVSLTVSANRTLTAVYGTGVVLSVQANKNAVPVQIWTRDRSGQTHGATSFTRLYAPGTAVSMTAPATASGKPFVRWEKDGVPVPGTSRTRAQPWMSLTRCRRFTRPNRIAFEPTGIRIGPVRLGVSGVELRRPIRPEYVIIERRTRRPVAL